ncbi:MAG TPA: PAS domain S-box protein [Methanotrichaceae archaeon]|nr:PAS domain S-box protein [Methanotrichaceae archaeon]
MKSLRTDSAKLGSANGSPKNTAPGQSHVLACSLDPGLNIVSANDAMCRFFDMSRKMLLGSSFICLIPEESQKEAAKILNSLSPEDPLAILEHSFHSSIGTLWLQWMNTAQFDCQGSLEAVHLAGLDITSQKEECQALRESEEAFRSMVERSIDVIFIVDLDENFSYISPAIESMMGIQAQELIGRSVYEGMFKEELSKTREALNSAFNGSPIKGHHCSIIRSDGSRMILEVNISPVFKDGQASGAQGIIRDITERMLAEERQCSAHKQLLDIIEFMPDAIFVIDQDKKVVAWNRAIEELTGVSKPEVIGRGSNAYSLPFSGQSGPMLIDLLDEPDYKAASIYPIVDRKGDALLAEASMPDRHRGGEICIWAKASPLHDSQGRKIGAIELIKDITEIKKAKDELSDARVELENRVRERTRELKNSNEALIEEIQERKHAECMIRSSLQEKEVLLREVYHRVKNNLQIISSLLSLQSEYIKDEKAIEAFRESRNRIRSMSLIHEKIYRSQDLTKIDFVDYSRNLISALMAAYNIRKNAIEVRLNAEGVFLEIDKAIPCGLIINELVSNALKHAFNQSLRGVIKIELKSQGDNELVLIISDDGCGFPEEMDVSKSKSFGLKLVSTLVEQLKGTIDLHREGGTQFRITFAI